MTKKTNALIIRFGVSTLWKNKSSIMKLLSNFLQLEKLIFFWLKKKTLNLLCFKFKNNLIHLYVYNHFYLDEKLKSEVIKYYKKTFDLNNMIKKFGISKKTLLFLLATTTNKKIKQDLNYLRNRFFSLLSLEIKKKTVLVFFIIINFLINEALSLLQDFVLLLNQSVFFRSKIKLKSNPYLNLRKINGFFKLKIIAKVLAILILKLKSQYISIKINNIFLNSGVNRILFFGKQVIKPAFRFKFFTIFLSIIYLQSKLLCEYLGNLIKKDKQHKKVLQTFIYFFEKIFYSRILILLGFQLRVTGKLGGKMRKTKFHYKLGKVKLQTLNCFLSYFLLASYTKFGIISIKVWLIR